jgi:hypothetical protein
MFPLPLAEQMMLLLSGLRRLKTVGTVTCSYFLVLTVIAGRDPAKAAFIILKFAVCTTAPVPGMTERPGKHRQKWMEIIGSFGNPIYKGGLFLKMLQKI